MKSLAVCLLVLVLVAPAQGATFINRFGKFSGTLAGIQIVSNDAPATVSFDIDGIDVDTVTIAECLLGSAGNNYAVYLCVGINLAGATNTTGTNSAVEVKEAGGLVLAKLTQTQVAPLNYTTAVHVLTGTGCALADFAVTAATTLTRQQVFSTLPNPGQTFTCETCAKTYATEIVVFAALFGVFVLATVAFGMLWAQERYRRGFAQYSGH